MLKFLSSKSRANKPNRKDWKFRPRLEFLEDRITPSHTGGGGGTTTTLAFSPGPETIAITAGSPEKITFTANTTNSCSWSESGSTDGMGYSISANTYTLSGTPTVAGNFSFSITVASGKTKTTQHYTLSVSPNTLNHFVVTAPGTATTNTLFNVTVTADDIYGNVVTSFNGSVNLGSNIGSVAPGAVTLTNGTVTTSVLLNTAGYLTLTASMGAVTGTSGSINVTSTGADWFAQSMPDAGLQNLARSDFADGSISYSDMVGLLNQAVSEGTVSSATFTSLQALVSSSGASYLHETADVQNLGYKLVNGDPSNAYFQGTISLGNLAVGSSATQLQELEEKWFLGEDHPIIDTQYWGTSGYALASGTLFGSSGAPQYTDIRQGEEGDCWFMASLATTANNTNTTKGQVTIEGQFIYEGTVLENGVQAQVWSVRFYNNGVAQYVTVDNYFPVNGSVFMYADFYQNVSSPSNVLWAALEEKAYAQLCASGWNSRPATNSYASLNGGWASTALPVITGSTTTNGSAFGSETAFISAIQSGTLLTMASWSTNYGFVADHDYAVISVTGSGSSALVQLYNPWGSDQPPAITWAQLTQSGDFTLDGNTVVSSAPGSEPLAGNPIASIVVSNSPTRSAGRLETSADNQPTATADGGTSLAIQTGYTGGSSKDIASGHTYLADSSGIADPLFNDVLSETGYFSGR